MSAAVEITHVNHTTEALHGLAAKSNNGPQVRQGDRIWLQHPNPVWATGKIERKRRKCD